MRTRTTVTGTATTQRNDETPGADNAGPGHNAAQANEQAATDGAATDTEGNSPDIREVADSVRTSTPDAATEVTIDDTRPDTPGATVRPETATQTVSEVTLDDETLRGSVEVTEYTNPPAEVTDALTASVASDLAAAGADPGERGASGEGTDSEGDEERPTEDATAATDESTVNVVTVADISVFDETGESASNTPATVAMQVDAAELNEPANAVVVHETDDGWERLETTVETTADEAETTTDETVTLRAKTGGFSLFAVAELNGENDTDSAETTNAINATTAPNATATTTNSTLGFGIGASFIALAATTLLAWRPGVA